jgi:hypothetical protein
MKELVEAIAKALVDYPDHVQARAIEGMAMRLAMLAMLDALNKGRVGSLRNGPWERSKRVDSWRGLQWRQSSNPEISSD